MYARDYTIITAEECVQDDPLRVYKKMPVTYATTPATVIETF